MRLKHSMLTALFAALTAIGAFLKIPLPFGLMPFTLQFFFTALSGLLLGARYGALSQAVYVLLGLLGVPVFMMGGGIGYVVQPSFGFLLGLIPGAWVIGTLGAKAARPWTMALAILAGFAAIYAVGLPYMGLICKVYRKEGLSLRQIVLGGCLIYLPGDLVKAALAGALCTAVRRRMKGRGMLL